MCKESMQASTCPRCKRRMYYAEQHMLVCDAPKIKIKLGPTVPRKKRKKEAASVA